MAGEADASAGVVKAAELRCEACGAPWEMRGFQTTRTVACEFCGSIFDVRGEMWELVEKVEREQKRRPIYALGTRGHLDGIEWEVIGWMMRSVRSGGTRYAWEEHLLYNPYEGFRYLIYQDGHFVVVAPIGSLPTMARNKATVFGRAYRHFSTGDAEVDEVLGEFPWEVRRGDMARATDCVAPPRILSCEESQGEIVWSEGRYLPREEVIAAFGRPTRAARIPSEPHPCQPNPHKALARWMAVAMLVAVAGWFLLTLTYVGAREDKVVFSGSVKDGDSISLDLTGSGSGTTLELAGEARLANSWVYLDCMLVDVEHETASYLGLEISYYYGSSGGERWSEGSRSASTVVSGVEDGRYLLQVTRHPQSPYKGPVTLVVRRDVTLYRYPLCTLILLLVLPAGVLFMSKSFEARRWRQSDHAGGG